MHQENVTNKVNQEEERYARKMEQAGAMLHRILADRVPTETILETHTQMLQALALAFNPHSPVSIPELTQGASWFMLNQFTHSLRSILHYRDTRLTAGDLLAEIDRRLPPPIASRNSPPRLQ